MINSAISLASNPETIEFIIYCDDDDQTMESFVAQNSTLIRGPKKSVSQMTNECFYQSSGSILMYAADDILFKTESWDLIVKKGLSGKSACLVYGNDLGRPRQEIATHGFMTRDFARLNGYLLPELFSADFCDTWLTSIARMAKSLKYMPELEIEHMHPSWGKSLIDQTYESREGKKNYLVLWVKFKLTFPIRLILAIKTLNYNSAGKLPI